MAKDSGALVCAQAILEDLLTIRADRDDTRQQAMEHLEAGDRSLE